MERVVRRELVERVNYQLVGTWKGAMGGYPNVPDFKLEFMGLRYKWYKQEFHTIQTFPKLLGVLKGIN